MTKQKSEAPALRWSWKLLTIAGIEVRVHATFLLLVAFVALGDLAAGQRVATVLRGTLLILAVFSVALGQKGGAYAHPAGKKAIRR